MMAGDFTQQARQAASRQPRQAAPPEVDVNWWEEAPVKSCFESLDRECGVWVGWIKSSGAPVLRQIRMSLTSHQRHGKQPRDSPVKPQLPKLMLIGGRMRLLETVSNSSFETLVAGSVSSKVRVE